MYVFAAADLYLNLEECALHERFTFAPRHAGKRDADFQQSEIQTETVTETVGKYLGVLRPVNR